MVLATLLACLFNAAPLASPLSWMAIEDTVFTLVARVSAPDATVSASSMEILKAVRPGPLRKRIADGCLDAIARDGAWKRHREVLVSATTWKKEVADVFAGWCLQDPEKAFRAVNRLEMPCLLDARLLLSRFDAEWWAYYLRNASRLRFGDRTLTGTLMNLASDPGSIDPASLWAALDSMEGELDPAAAWLFELGLERFEAGSDQSREQGRLIFLALSHCRDSMFVKFKWLVEEPTTWPEMRAAAFESLSRMQEEDGHSCMARLEVSLLVALTSEELFGIRSLALGALAELGPRVLSHIRDLEKLLECNSHEDAARAAAIIFTHRPGHAKARSRILELLSSEENRDGVGFILQALGERKAEAVFALPALIRSVSRGLPCMYCMQFLGRLGPLALPALPVLAELSLSADPAMRRMAIDAIHGIVAPIVAFH